MRIAGIWVAAMLALGLGLTPGTMAQAAAHKTAPATAHHATIDWDSKPTAEDLAWAYPREAALQEIEGRAQIGCDVTDDGHLAHCMVVSESPVGHGFGAAALKVAPSFRMHVPSGTPPAARRVRIPLHFAMARDETPFDLKNRSVDLLQMAAVVLVAALLPAALAALLWALAAGMRRMSESETDDLFDTPSWAGHGARLYRIESFLGGRDGAWAVLTLSLGSALLVAVAIAQSEGVLPAPVKAVIPFANAAVCAALVWGVWRLVGLFRTFVEIDDQSISRQGAIAFRRLLRSDITGVRVSTSGRRPVLRITSDAPGERPLNIPIFWKADPKFDAWVASFPDPASMSPAREGD